MSFGFLTDLNFLLVEFLERFTLMESEIRTPKLKISLPFKFMPIEAYKASDKYQAHPFNTSYAACH